MTDSQQPEVTRLSDDVMQSRRSLAERLFPGPTRPHDRATAERFRQLLRAHDAVPGRQPTGSESSASTAREANGSTSDEQTKLLRALLSTSMETQTDARATAQNARTFAWAGTAIALLTLIGTVILAVRG